jgi:hypothetical protein
MTDVPIDPSNPAVRAAVLYDISPYGEDFFPVPSTDGVPFVLYIRYTSETIHGRNAQLRRGFLPALRESDIRRVQPLFHVGGQGRLR